MRRHVVVIIFTARRGLCCLEMSVCPSKQLNLQLFSPSDSHAILVFPHQTLWQYFDGDPLTGGAECRGSMKKMRFSINISLYLGNDKDRAIVIMECKRENSLKLSNGTIFNDLERLSEIFIIIIIIINVSINNSVTSWARHQ